MKPPIREAFGKLERKAGVAGKMGEVVAWHPLAHHSIDAAACFEAIVHVNAVRRALPKAFDASQNVLPESASFEHLFAGIVQLADRLAPTVISFPVQTTRANSTTPVPVPAPILALTPKPKPT